MKEWIIYHERFNKKSCILLSIIIVSLLLFTSCKKDPIQSISPPLAMEVISGNNQVGYPYRELSDTIIIKITPKNKTDVGSYRYFFRNNTGGIPMAYSTVSNDEYFIKVVWTMSGSTSPQQITLVLFGDCANPYDNYCNPLDSVVLKATINDRQWVKLYSDNSGIIGPGAFWDIHFSDATNGVVVGDFQTGIITTNDGGNTWHPVSSNRNDYYKLSFFDKDNGLAIVTNNYAYFTTDGGNSFIPGLWTPPIIGHLSSADYFMINRNIIFSVGNQGTITKSMDGGASWTRYNGFNFINRISSITCTDANTCYACGQVAKIIKTIDAGNTWTEQPILINNHLRKIYFFDKEFGFAGGQYGSLVRTTDGGAHWSVMHTGLNAEIMEIRFFNNMLGFIVSSTGEIAKTTDGGLTWKKIVAYNYGVYELNKAFIIDSTRVLGLYAQGIYKYDLR